MPSASSSRPHPSYVATPQGLFTASGTWFYTREEEVKAYAGPLLDKVTLDALVIQADGWLRTPQTLALVALAAGLLTMAPGLALLLSLGVFVVWSAVGPGMFSRILWQNVLRWLDHVAVQMLLFVVVLSMLGMAGAYLAVVTGLLGFVLLRWGVLQRLFQKVIEAAHARLYPMHAADHVLRSAIIRAALQYRVDLPELDRMAQRLTDIMNYKRR